MASATFPRGEQVSLSRRGKAGVGVGISSESSNGDLIERLCELADSAPEQLLYVELAQGTEETARLTAAGLRDGAAALAASLAARGVAPGEVALHIASSPVEFLIGLFGCMWAGVIAAPIAFPRRPEHLESRLEPVRHNAGAAAIVAGTPQGKAEQAVLELLTGGALPVLSIVAPAPDIAPAPHADRDIAYLQYTSGSTSEPKGVIVSHANLVANLDLSSELLGCGADTVTVCWNPLTHDMGLILGALSAVHFGSISVLMPPGAFIRRPLAWLRAIDTYRGTHSYSPNFGYDLCVERTTAEERAGLDLSSMRVFINGAEPVREPTGARFLEAFAVSGLRPEAYTPAYGLAEATVLVTATPPDSSGIVLWGDVAGLERDEIVLAEPDSPGARTLCADGVTASSHEVAIVEPDTGRRAAPGRVAEVWLRGPSICRGYWQRPAETEATFGSRIVGEDGGPWLRTGDLGFLHEGQLVICGRAKDLIVIHGRNIHPQDIEFSGELAHPAVRLGGSAAFAVETADGTEAAVLVVEVDGEPDPEEVSAAIKSRVWKDFEVELVDVLLVGPQQVPKTSSGKKQRSASRELWLQARAGAGASPS
jgi:acyl-CoA synthetase (AMP-forming)/AMP-acid ligase II